MKCFDVARNRSSNIELLRCICMFLIIYLHILIHGVNGEFARFNNQDVLPTTLLESFSSIFCMVAVNVFVIISGYFGIKVLEDKSTIKIQKVLKNYWIILFYSVTISVIFFLMRKISVIDFILSFFPVITVKWWFATCYMGLVIMSPFLNLIVEKNWNNLYLYVVLFFISLSTYLFEGSDFCNVLGFKSLGFSTILICYILGRCIFFLYENNVVLVKKKSSIYFLFYVSCCVVSFLGTLFLFVLTKKNYWFRVSTYVSPVTLFGSIFLFLTFLNLKMKKSNMINLFGNTTFGIYLIHENPRIRPVLYGIIDAVKFKESGFIYLFIYLLFICICVFLFCSFIDFIRNLLFELFGIILYRKKK